MTKQVLNPRKETLYDLVIPDIPVHHGDLVIYASRTSLVHSGHIGMVVGTDDTGKHLVMWSHKQGLVFDLHEPKMLLTIARGYVEGEPYDDLVVLPSKPARFFVDKAKR